MKAVLCKSFVLLNLSLEEVDEPNTVGRYCRRPCKRREPDVLMIEASISHPDFPFSPANLAASLPR